MLPPLFKQSEGISVRSYQNWIAGTECSKLNAFIANVHVACKLNPRVNFYFGVVLSGYKSYENLD